MILVCVPSFLIIEPILAKANDFGSKTAAILSNFSGRIGFSIKNTLT